MADNSENILVEFDYNNITIIDPNKVIDENGNAKFGFDKYGEQSLDFNYIKNFLIEIYGENNYDYHYNNESDNVGQGLIYIYGNNG